MGRDVKSGIAKCCYNIGQNGWKINTTPPPRASQGCFCFSFYSVQDCSSVQYFSFQLWLGVFVDKKQTYRGNNAVVKKAKEKHEALICSWSEVIRHQSFITYVVNFIGHCWSGKFKDWFHDKKALKFGLNTVLDVTEMPKLQKPCWPYGHLKVPNYLKRSFSYNGALFWNKLPHELRNAGSGRRFKS